LPTFGNVRRLASGLHRFFRSLAKGLHFLVQSSQLAQNLLALVMRFFVGCFGHGGYDHTDEEVQNDEGGEQDEGDEEARSSSLPASGRDRGFGMLDCVSRHLRANTGEVEYDLVCRETTPTRL
jgi:hypothetical protein